LVELRNSRLFLTETLTPIGYHLSRKAVNQSALIPDS